MIRVPQLFWTGVTALMLAAASPTAHACTACFGKSDSNMARGMNMGIFALLLVITSVLCGVAGFFVFIARRNSQLHDPAFTTDLTENRTNA